MREAGGAGPDPGQLRAARLAGDDELRGQPGALRAGGLEHVRGALGVQARHVGGVLERAAERGRGGEHDGRDGEPGADRGPWVTGGGAAQPEEEVGHGPIVPSRGGRDHRATGHTSLVLAAGARTVLPADARPVRDLYRGLVVSALRSFWAEPPAPDPPARVWWDWPLVVLLVVGGTLEAALREDMPARAVAFVVAVTPVLLLWRRARPLPVTVALFGVNVLGDAVTRIATGEPMELYASVYVLLLPYTLFRWGAGRDAVLGMAFVLASHATLSAADGAWGDIALGVPFLLLPAALGASVRYRASSRQRETDQVKLREREQLARELHDTVAHHVSAIAIQAQAGRTLAASQPEAAVRALEVIEEAASRTLEELRGLVDALRAGRGARARAAARGGRHRAAGGTPATARPSRSS